MPITLILMGRNTSIPREVPNHSDWQTRVTGTSTRLLFMRALRPPCLNPDGLGHMDFIFLRHTLQTVQNRQCARTTCYYVGAAW